MKLGLFGRPTSRFSPRLLRACHLLKRPISYAAVEVYPGELARSRRRVAGWLGANVTSPLKEKRRRSRTR